MEGYKIIVEQNSDGLYSVTIMENPPFKKRFDHIHPIAIGALVDELLRNHDQTYYEIINSAKEILYGTTKRI